MKYITGITSKIEYDQWTVNVVWDMCYWYDYPSEEPNGIQSNIKQEYRSVEKIKRIEVSEINDTVLSKILSQSQRIKRNLEKKLLQSVDNVSINELKYQLV